MSDKTALVLIDIQNDYFPGGTMELAGAHAAAQQAARLLAWFREKSWPVVHIQHIATKPDATFFLPGTHGANVHESVAPLNDEPVFQKHFPSSFRDTPLRQHLQDAGVRKLVIVGMMTHMCVDTTVRAAFDLGFSTLLAHDACATRDLSFDGQIVGAADVQRAYMAALGVFANVLSASEIERKLATA